jgi:hypothetical protein
MAIYESELTGFLRTLKKQHPEIDEQQREGRALWWDRKSDPEDVDRWEKARPERTSYVYYRTGKPAS